MPSLRAYSLALLGLCFWGWNPALGQSSEKTPTSNEITVRGCVIGGPDTFYLATTGNVETPEFFILTGATAGLEKYVYREVSVQGRKSGSDEGRSFQVTRVIEIFREPQPRLSSAFNDRSKWRHERKNEYGVELAYPPSFAAVPTEEPRPLEPNMASEEKVNAVARFDIPREIYPGSNFVGGAFAVFANPGLSNAPSCKDTRRQGASRKSNTPKRYVAGRRPGRAITTTLCTLFCMASATK